MTSPALSLISPATAEESGPVAFVLSGGASHGAVQVGMLTALAWAGIVPDFVIGASVGALNAAAFGADPTPQGLARLAEVWRQVKRREVFPLRLRPLMLGAVGRRDHLVPNQALRALISRTIHLARLEDTLIPVHVMATEVATGRPVTISRGDIITALLASCAIPGVYPPVEMGDQTLIDGGVGANSPVRAAEDLGARSIYVLPTFGVGPDPSRRVSAAQAALQGLGYLAEQADRQAIAAARQAHVHVLPVPPTSGINPFKLSDSARLIDAAAQLTWAWLTNRAEASEPADRKGRSASR